MLDWTTTILNWYHFCAWLIHSWFSFRVCTNLEKTQKDDTKLLEIVRCCFPFSVHVFSFCFSEESTHQKKKTEVRRATNKVTRNLESNLLPWQVVKISLPSPKSLCNEKFLSYWYQSPEYLQNAYLYEPVSTFLPLPYLTSFIKVHDEIKERASPKQYQGNCRKKVCVREQQNNV